ncbi:TolC family protein [Parvularcula oceani]|uniref:TolC family protein n=1 Tax=Parvularcula oceani TaxID=1247963 RepID=UPI0004E22EE8|nr:TolC family protein [Parvularcula oceani]
MRRALLLAAGLAGLLPGAAAAQESCLRFETALREALDFDPRIEGAEADKEQARANALAAYSRNLPDVSLFGQASLGNTQPLDTTRGDSYGIQATQELFSFGARKAAQAAARAQLEAARAGVAEAQIDVAEGVALAYLDTLRTRAVAGLTAEQARAYESDALQAEGRLERQVITLTDASQIRARYATARSRTLDAEVEAEAALVRLRVLTDRAVPCVALESVTELLGANAGALLALSPEAAVARATDRSFALRRARSAVTAASASLSEAQRANLPTVSANAFALHQQDPLFGQDENEARLGISIRQDLYTGGRHRAQRLDARARLKGAQADRDFERLILEDRVRRALARAKAAQAAGEALLEAASEARIQLDATTTEYERGTKTLTDLVLANEAYYGAALSETDARFRFYSALVSLHAALGILTDPVEG